MYRAYQASQGAVSQQACGGLYRRSFLKQFAPLLDQSRMPDLKSWHGAPSAALRHAFMALSSVRFAALPTDIHDGLRRLQELYSREPPHLSTTSDNMAQQLLIDANESKRKHDDDDLERPPPKSKCLDQSSDQERPQ
jgi:hypothetical protein